MTGAAHTATPWSRNIKPVSRYPIIFAGRNTHVLQVITRGVSESEAEANIEFVLLAVNAHAELVAALRAAVGALEYAVNKLDNPTINGHRVLADRLEEARAALAKATGDAA